MSLMVDVTAARPEFTVDAAFSADDGETVALLGPNGAGKSTLVHAIAGLLPPARGRIELGGRVLDDTETRTHASPAERGVGVLFQERRLFPHMTVLE
ncbi:MAG: ATP-binding cassette domain-containing protein, partial [Actinomycetota bacterium]